jgi:hypothetical protein
MQGGAGEIGTIEITLAQVKALEIRAGKVALWTILAAPRQKTARGIGIGRSACCRACEQKPERQDREAALHRLT